MNEFELINSLNRFQNLSSQVVAGMGDDAAVLQLNAKCYQLLTTDMLVEGVHFRREMIPKLIGRKALACNISDIAAMGGLPTNAVISIGIPKGIPAKFVQDLYAGMSALAKQFGVSLVGGDTVRADRIVINVALLGEVEKRSCVFRGGAKPGDGIFVTGPLGGSLASGRHLTFMPRVAEARWLVRHIKPSAMMDISDGLAGDIRHILNASSVGAVLEAGSIPIHKGVTLAQALSDGEDFELLFTVPQARAGKCPFPMIGRVTRDRDRLLLQDRAGKQRRLQARGFTHF